jgi:hypothetical protein
MHRSAWLSHVEEDVKVGPARASGGRGRLRTRPLVCGRPGRAPGWLQGDLPGAVEQAHAAARDNRDEVDLDLVEQPGLQVLPGEVGATDDQDVLAARGCPRPLQRHLDALGDEAVGRASVLGHRGPGAVGDDEHRHRERRVVAPRRLTDVEHRPADQDGAGAVVQLVADLGVDVARVTGAVVAVAEVGDPGHLPVELVAALPSGSPGRGSGPVMKPSNDIEVSYSSPAIVHPPIAASRR